MHIGTGIHNVSYQNSCVHKEESGQNQGVCAVENKDNEKTDPTKQKLSKIEPSQPELSKQDMSKKTGSQSEPYYEYIPGGDRSEKPSGIYQLEKDENGRSKIIYDRFDSAQSGDKATNPTENSEAPRVNNALPSEDSTNPTQDHAKPEKEDYLGMGNEKEAKKCTTNTDQVDAEIKKLKEEIRQIKQQLNYVKDDEDKSKELQKRLSQVEAELSAKDNDAYRKQHASYTMAP